MSSQPGSMTVGFRTSRDGGRQGKAIRPKRLLHSPYSALFCAGTLRSSAAGSAGALSTSFDKGMDSRGRSTAGELPGDVSAWMHSGMDLKHGLTGGRLTQMHLASPRSPGGGVGLRESFDPRMMASRPPPPPRTATATPGSRGSDMAELSGSGAGVRDGLLSPSRPPPAGMRGAFSWGVGPNAYEVDGRPGTRGGGPSCELDSRPISRPGGNR